MHPILFRIGDFEVHSFGLMMAFAWLAAGAYLDREFRRHVSRVPRALVGDLIVWALAGSLIGARLLYLAVEYPSWTADAWSAVFSRSGFVFYGGLVGGVAAGVWLVRRRGLSIRAVGDVVAPALALGLCVGRIGCFLAGDDYGKPSDVPWAVTFTDPDTLAPPGVPLHPAQLYLSANALAIFLILNFLLPRRMFKGQVLSLFLMLYPAGRFLLEFFRGDPRGAWGPFSTSQWISLLVFPAGIWLYAWLRRTK
ncbi:MAG: prolipoprotein diacylglyceryl transferase [Candidatus Lindowbacteria bacterium RIFCSPLOWO2_12_FULL_62_27]|nr:MAG: prolipoprotein diacylglyceryl transferase [Candidatus Lindowbacteria bacterium RIFCSPLOWO2_12_FULL_62_27]